MNRSPEEQAAIRQDIFAWLERQEVAQGGYAFQRDFLRTEYQFRGEVIALLDRQTGIWNPSGFDATLSITMTQKGPYEDEADGAIQKYSYERLNGRPLTSGRNKKLRRAAELRAPLILFQEDSPSLYVPSYPVYIVRDDPDEGYVYIAMDESLRSFNDPLELAEEQRRYAQRVISQRLHQKKFRSRVLLAYDGKCAVCRLTHSVLLDAAHITPDGAESSSTAVTNGLALCKIHHAAYDHSLLGIDANYHVHIRRDILLQKATATPMVKHGIQAMDGTTIELPERRREHPDRDRLQARFLEFLG